jgi:amino acid transporter
MGLQKSELIRGLSRWDLFALVINTVIGAGIFGLPSRTYALAGTYSLLAYLVCAVPVVLMIVCFAEVGSRFKETGGPYLYARVAFGPLAAFEIGWLMWLARVTAFAALCNLFVDYLAYFLPVASGVARSVAIVVVVSLLTGVNVVGVRTTARVNTFFTFGKLIPLFAFVAVGAFFVDVQRYSFAQPPAYGNFAQATLLLVFAFTGFEVAVIAAAETRDPQHDVPFGLLAGIATIATLYILIQIVCIGTFPGLAKSERPLADAASLFVGSPGAAVISAGALLSIGGTMNASVFGIPRVLFAMAQQSDLPPIFLRTHKTFRTPYIAIVTSAGLMLLFTLFSTFISALTISTIIRLIVYIVTCASLPVLRRKSEAPPAAFLAPWGRAASFAACVLGVWLLSNSSWKEAWIVAILSLIGVALWLPRKYFARVRI